MERRKYRYLAFNQQPFCCVPACIQMIMYRRRIPLFSQELIGSELGLVVPKRTTWILHNARTGKRPVSGWGTQVEREEYSLNSFFERNSIPLYERYYSPEKIHSLTQVLLNHKRQDDDLMACFRYGTLYGTKSINGHVSLVESIHEDTVLLVDPKYGVPKFREVSVTRLKKAIEIHGQIRRAGIWSISGTD